MCADFKNKYLNSLIFFKSIYIKLKVPIFENKYIIHYAVVEYFKIAKPEDVTKNSVLRFFKNIVTFKILKRFCVRLHGWREFCI